MGSLISVRSAAGKGLPQTNDLPPAKTRRKQTDPPAKRSGPGQRGN
jgi:hypothetical protein